MQHDIQIRGWSPGEPIELAMAKLDAPGVSSHALTGQIPRLKLVVYDCGLAPRPTYEEYERTRITSYFGPIREGPRLGPIP